MKTHLFLFFLIALRATVHANVSVSVDAEQDNVPISPYLYGKNVRETDPGVTSDSVRFLIKESGLKFVRMNEGNNSSKYNWRKRLSSHPDWYNNVSTTNWDQSARLLNDKLPGVKAMYGFQMMGKVAKSEAYNFNSMSYNYSKGGRWCRQNLCGNGVAAPDGEMAAVEGDTSLYLQSWPADSSVAIYTHWQKDLQLNMRQFEYWDMDNEMELWNETHDDAVKTCDAEDMMRKYFATAKAARAVSQDMKLCGPVSASEWYWYVTRSGLPVYKGKKYCWLEYFIMRCAEEQRATGVRMLDVLDIHDYPEETNTDEVLQTHRVFFDTTYVYSKAHGVQAVSGEWDSSVNKEYVFVRCQQWLDKYFGAHNDITFGVSEFNVKTPSMMVNVLSYASMLGEFGRHGVTFFCPWNWYPGMWETLHLFSRYGHCTSVKATSSDEAMVSAYPMLNASRDSMTILLVNRSQVESKTVNMSIANFDVPNGTCETLQLANLPDQETFVSHTKNALQHGQITVGSNAFSITLPALSVTAVRLHKTPVSAR